MARGLNRRPHRSWPQRLLLSANVLLVVACVLAAAGLSKVRSTIEDVPVVDIGTSLAPETEAASPKNFLIIGTDSAVGLDKDDPVLDKRELSGQLADVIMIVRADPIDHTVKLLSIPRDSRVELAPSGNMGRINAAMSGVGGEVNLVQTIKRNFGIQIDNYVQINFLAFRELVEVLGGVPVYFTTPVRDRNSGLAIDEAGCRMLDPGQALAYARARHLYFYDDGKWRPDGTGDLGRISRQQDFIKRALRRAAEKGLRNPNTALNVINAAAGAVKMDTTLDVGTLLALAKEFQSFNPESLESMQVPTYYAPRGGVAYQDIDWAEAEPLLEQFRGVDPKAGIKPANVIVSVTSRSREEDRLDEIVKRLDSAGFDADTYRSRSAPRNTTIYYGSRGRDAAILLAAQLGSMPEFTFDSTIVGYRVKFAVGNDFAEVLDVPVPIDRLSPTELPPPSEKQSTAEAGDDEDGSTAVESPSTSVDSGNANPQEDEAQEPGVVPVDPEASALCR